MLAARTSSTEESKASDGKSSLDPPAITLPKGGGAIRGVGEKFTANPVTGTGSMSVPISTSPGRSGLGPQLSLSYDSGAGNGPFGFGWSLSLPAITRKTEKGLPLYNDAAESDVFILSGAEDLVPVLIQNEGIWERERLPTRTVNGATYRVDRYRPRVEGLFARIERWTNTADATDVCWRSISKDNITTWYGTTPDSRIADPANNSHIFSWLICQSYDDKGNVIVYGYKSEDSARIFEDASGNRITKPHERNRTDESRSAQRYLKHIRYGNCLPYFPVLWEDASWPEPPSVNARDGSNDWYFEVVFDYGEHDTSTPTPSDKGAWPVRGDPFSSYRAGFEVRTYRLCQRVLIFHHFPGEKDVGSDCLVRSTDFTYSYEQKPDDTRDPIYSFLCSVTQTGYKRNGAAYRQRSLPPIEFTYSPAAVQDSVHEVDAASLENLPIGLDGAVYQWADLHGEGIPGILTEQANVWFYKRNLSPISECSVEFAPLECAGTKPNLALAGGAQIMDLAGDGQPDLVVFDGPTTGLYKHDEAESWQPFRPFTARLNRDMRDPNLRFVDLDGDGHADVLITEDNVLIWHASLAEEGFGTARRVPQALDEEKGSRLVFADGTQSIYLADLSGDGLTDLVRIRNGEVCYWPNLGYGRFGAKVTMDGSPWFDAPDQFNQKRIRLADIDGSGTTDIIYLHRDGVRLYFNQSGNSWGEPHVLSVFPRIDDLISIVPVDLLGNGTACLVWSSPLPGDSWRSMRYVNLMGEQKPHLLIKTINNLGAETRVTYAPSTKFYLLDKRDGKPWITRLPFPVHVVERVSVSDRWRKTTFSSSYSYHHGYFDGTEREFRGFGRVEQIDTEDYGTFSAGNVASPYITDDHRLFQPPVKTVTWYHTGIFTDEARVLSLYEDEYFPNWFESTNPQTADVLGDFQENRLPEPDFADLDLTPDEWREALRACKGIALRQEVYELDVDALRDGDHRPVKLFSTAYHNSHIDRLQPQGTQRHAVFLVTESEAITYHYELDLRAAQVKPDPRVAHTLNLCIDEFGHVLQSVAVGYPRFLAFEDADLSSQAVNLVRSVQGELHIAYVETRYTDKDIDEPDTYRLRLPCEVQTYELTGINPLDAGDAQTTDTRDDQYFSIDELRAYRLSEQYQSTGTPVGLLQYHEQPDRATRPFPPQKRLVEHVRTLYFDDASGTVAPIKHLPFRQHGPRGLKYEDYKLALTDALLADVFGTRLDDPIDGSTGRQKLATTPTSGYITQTDLSDRFGSIGTAGQYWIRSGVVGFALDAAQHFFLPERYTDPFGNDTVVSYDARDLYVEWTRDARDNETRLIDFDYRVLVPRAIRNANGDVSRAAFDILGMPVAVAFEGGGDSLDGLTETLLDPPVAELVGFFSSAYAEDKPRDWLATATSRFVYHFGEEAVDATGKVTRWEARPAAACSIQRETHIGHLSGDQTRIQVAVEYSDGSGDVVVKKAQAEPAPDNTTGRLRWIASGKTVVNNKGKPVKQYEPYFSETEHRYDKLEAEREIGVTPILYYDAPGRLVRTEMPEGTVSGVEFSPWHVTTFDANDTVVDSRWYRERRTADERRVASADSAEEARAATASIHDKRAARLAALHADTPARTLLDSLGREVISIAHNREPSQNPSQANVQLIDRPWLDRRDLTFTRLDAEGKPLWIRDARGNLVMQYITPPRANSDRSDAMPSGAAPCYDIAGNLLFQHSMDAGERRMLMDAAGKPMLAWDENDRGLGTTALRHTFFTKYDALHRPTKQWLKLDDNPPALVEVFEYCDTTQPNGAANLADAQDRRLIGQAVRHWDPSGLATVERVDLSGKPAHITRTLIKPETDGDTGLVNWNAADRAGLLEGETFNQLTEYDALGRLTRLYNWHRDITFGANGADQATPGATNRVAIYEPEYNERGALCAERLHIRATKMTGADGQASFTSDPQRSLQAIKRITYNEKGQKLSLELGNGSTTRYTYDPQTFHLMHLFTQRSGTIAANDCTSNTTDAPRPGRSCGVQNLSYTYDPVGNITHIQDDAQQSIYFCNSEVEPSNDYTYDALYRLIEATGRENVPPVEPPSHREGPWPTGVFCSPEQLRNYTQRYQYDAVGNFVEMRHIVSVGSGWTRHYSTQTDSNHLDQTWYGSNLLEAVTYYHDAHGNTLNLNRTTPPLDPEEGWGLDIHWDWRNMIMGFDLGGGGVARYHYGIDKQRTRKHITRQGNTTEDRIYLGGYELYRRRNAQGTVVEEIESLHLFEGEQRVLLVDDVIKAGGASQTRFDGLPVGEQTLWRYQYGNHLGSACLDLDHEAKIISYEEYHPYGTCAYRLMNSAVEAPPKRYRYTGKERDEESGLYYYGARHYAAWLGMWVTYDPLGPIDSLSLYVFVKNNPIRNFDPTGNLNEDIVQPKLSNSENATPSPLFDLTDEGDNDVMNYQEIDLADYSGKVGVNDQKAKQFNQQPVMPVNSTNTFSPSMPHGLTLLPNTVGNGPVLGMSNSTMPHVLTLPPNTVGNGPVLGMSNSILQVAPWFGERNLILGGGRRLLMLGIESISKSQSILLDMIEPGCLLPSKENLAQAFLLRARYDYLSKVASSLKIIGAAGNLLSMGKDFVEVGAATAYGTPQQVDRASQQLGANSAGVLMGVLASGVLTPLGGALVGYGTTKLLSPDFKPPNLDPHNHWRR